MSNLHILANLFNLIYIIGFIIPNMFWLRIVMIIGAILEIIFLLLVNNTELYISIAWCVVWIIVNSVQLFLITRDRISLKLNEEEIAIYNNKFKSLDKINFKKLIKIAELKTYKQDEIIIKSEKEFDNLIFIIDGIAKVLIDDNIITYISNGNFAGELSYITNNKTTADVIAHSDIKVYEWRKDSLERLTKKNKAINSGLKFIFNIDLANKLNSKK